MKITNNSTINVASSPGHVQTLSHVEVEDGSKIYLSSTGGKILIYNLIDHGHSLDKYEPQPGLIVINHYLTDHPFDDKNAKLKQQIAVLTK